jgi:hypothetical protein
VTLCTKSPTFIDALVLSTAPRQNREWLRLVCGDLHDGLAVKLGAVFVVALARIVKTDRDELAMKRRDIPKFCSAWLSACVSCY